MHAASFAKTAASILTAFVVAGAGMQTAQAAQPVLVELFTSEGCSSCPPADALLRSLVTSQPIAGVEVIALEEHVDYWNGLGWRDPYSAAQFTRRQYQYAAAMHESSAYTPQMVVDGRVGFVGSEAGRAHAAIAAAATARLATISLTRTYTQANTVGLRIAMQQLPADSADKMAEVWLAVTEDDLADRVTAGENDGRRLVHDAVVRRLERIGQVSVNAAGDYSADPTVTLAPGWHKSHLHAVVFVQGATSRHILGIASLALGPVKVTKR
ncbi:MAG: DUF1223 domain-containing protein [Gammaproteobacteria bacterium]